MISPNLNLPFISILVMGHNQESFMAACVDSVLAQEYAGKLEIILCDDCSTDGTYDIMLQKAAAYTGPHSVITHRCTTNGKVAVNMNVAVSLSHGDWLMRVDGDDILHPDRTRLTALAITRYPQATAISGKLVPFSSTPSPICNPPDSELDFLVADKTQINATHKPAGLEWWGCMMTLSRRIFTEFGDLPPICYVLDDTMFATRALMLGQFIIIRNGILLYYRRHSGNISSATDDHSRKSIRQFLQADTAARDYYRRGLPCHQPILAEIESYTDSHPEAQGLLEHFRSHFATLRRHAHFWDKSWRERIRDAHIQGSILHKIPHALTVFSPLTFALCQWAKQLFRSK